MGFTLTTDLRTYAIDRRLCEALSVDSEASHMLLYVTER